MGWVLCKSKVTFVDGAKTSRCVAPDAFHDRQRSTANKDTQHRHVKRCNILVQRLCQAWQNGRRNAVTQSRSDVLDAQGLRPEREILMMSREYAHTVSA